jgi:hypothetical protein
MKMVMKSISLKELIEMSHRMHEELVKAVVDIDKGIMIVDIDMHVDAELELLESGSQQKNLWGINIHPLETKENRIEFDSMINIRPSSGNRSRGVEDKEVQKKIISLVNKLVSNDNT